MTYHTPVLISDDPHAQQAAQRRGWKVLLRDEQVMRFEGLDHSQTLALPPLPFSIDDGSLSAAQAPGWDNLLNWLQKHIHRPMLVVAPDDWAGELALWAAASRGWPFALWIDGAPPLHTPSVAACMLSAEGLFVPKPEALEVLRKRWKEPFVELPTTPLVRVVARAQPAVAPDQPDVVRVLVVSHHGAAPELEADDILVDVVTAVRHPEPGEREHYVANLGAPGLANGPGVLPAWAAAGVAAGKERAVASSDHIGGYWRWRLEEYFNQRNDHYDVVWLRGEPYVTAEFALYAKRRWYARVILEPHTWARYEDEGERTQVAYDMAGWKMHADAVLTGEEPPAEVVELIRSLGDHRFE
ncbi:MAG: hypothetical protein Q4G35_06840 [Propionibacteriaceae bacterium]|nr:hypothetical protein [Propionibacteriaceae bacterium]